MDTFSESSDRGKHMDALFSMWREVKSQHEPEKQQLTRQNESTIDIVHRSSDRLVELQAAYTQIQQENTHLISQLQDLSQENRMLNQKFHKIEESLDDLYKDKLQIGAARLDIEALRSDNERLVKLLASTSEYKHCFANDVKVTYLKGAKLAKTNTQPRVKLISKNENIPEQLLWVPEQAVKVLQKYPLSDDDRVELLALLNKTFHDTWNQKVKKIKQSKDQDVATLQRQLQSRTPFDQLHAQKHISRLKSQLTQQRSTKDPDQRMTSTISQVQDCYKRIHEQQHQIQELTVQLEEARDTLEKQELGTQHRKDIFLKGAMWMGNDTDLQLVERILEELEAHKQEMERVTLNLNDRIESLLDSHDIIEQQIISRVYKWLSDVVHETQYNLYDRIVAISRSTQQRTS